MDDQFMYGLRSTPSRQFEDRLRERIAGLGRRSDAESPLRTGRWAVAALLVFGLALLVFPAVRASAQAFLNLFRVVNFTAVPVNVDRLNQLAQNGLDLPRLIGQQVEVLEDPGPPRVFSTLDEAAAASRMLINLPAVVPPGLVMARIEMTGQHTARVKADTRKLQDVLDALGITDLRAPDGLDGQLATVRVPPIVRVVYANGDQEVAFSQARSPEITLPSGMNLSALGEIGLRIVGLDAGEAHTLAQAIDWQGTLIVPVPAGVSSFRQVAIRGNRGLLVASTQRRDIKAVVWSARGSVYGITGALNDQRMLQMADSVP